MVCIGISEVENAGVPNMKRPKRLKWTPLGSCSPALRRGSDGGHRGQPEAALHGERADHSAIADQLQHRIDAFRVPVTHVLRQVWQFPHNLAGAQRLERLGALWVARRGNDAGAGWAAIFNAA
jgi:hypothetical protein